LGAKGQRTMFILGSLESASGLPISVDWTFLARYYGWGAKGENKSKIGVLKVSGSVCAKFSRRRGRPPPIILARIVRPMNALRLWWTHLSSVLPQCTRLTDRHRPTNRQTNGQTDTFLIVSRRWHSILLLTKL